MDLKFSAFRRSLLLGLFHLVGVCFAGVASAAEQGAYLLFENYTLPKSVTLCGEPIPVENPRVYEMLDREFTIVVWDKAQVFMWLKRAGRYFPYIEQKLAEAGMPDDLKYLAVAESSLLTHVGSEDGAKGLWQLMARTAQHNGIRKDFMVDERLELEQATDVALNHLKMLKDKFNTWALTLAAYNCGEGCINNEIAEQQVSDYYRLNLPLETERFVFRIAAIKIVMDNPALYGYNLVKEDQYAPIPYDTVPVDIKAALHITDVAKALDTDFKVLKELNPKIPGYYLPPGAYVINVPSGAGPKVGGTIGALEERASQLKTPPHFYIVRPGDTLEDISKKMGVSVDRLKELNRIKGSVIKVGQKLRL